MSTLDYFGMKIKFKISRKRYVIVRYKNQSLTNNYEDSTIRFIIFHIINERKRERNIDSARIFFYEILLFQFNLHN